MALLLLAGCGSSGSSTSASASSSESSAASSTASMPAASGSVAAAAQAFAATLSSDQTSSRMQEYSLANAEKWFKLPQSLLRGGEARIGLQLSTLSADPQKALATLLQTAAGSATEEGWDEIQQSSNADDYLSE